MDPGISLDVCHSFLQNPSLGPNCRCFAGLITRDSGLAEGAEHDQYSVVPIFFDPKWDIPETLAVKYKQQL